jgi:hypothetical protein
MNTIDKIISGPNKKQIIPNLTAFFIRHGILDGQNFDEDEKWTRSFYYKYKKADPKAVDIADTVKEKEKLLHREYKRNWLTEHNPLSTIVKSIEDCDKSIKSWAEEFVMDPFNKLSWGDSIVRIAARREIYLEIKRWLNNQYYSSTTAETRPAWDEIKQHMREQAIAMASSPASSTSPMSNFTENCKMAAYANVSRGFAGDSVCSEITYWFQEKERYDRGE